MGITNLKRKMKHIILSILITLSGSSVFAQQAPSQAMRTYIDGCNSLLTAIGEKDIINLVYAEKTLNGVQLIQYTPFEDFEPADSCTMNVLKAPEILFTGEYVDYIIKNNIKEFVPVEEPYILRKGENYDLQVWHASILPNSTATFKAAGVGYCEMLLLWASSSDMILKVKPSYSTDVSYICGNNYQCAMWDMNNESEFIFVIENKSEASQSFVLAIN